MPALHPLQSQRLINTCSSVLIGSQRRWARVYDVRFVATQPRESILERYKHKLDRKAKEHGFSDIKELKEAYKDKIAEVKDKPAVGGKDHSVHAPSSGSPPSARKESLHSPAQSYDQSSTFPPNNNPPGLKNLSAFLDVRKTLELPAREIESIWRLRHASKKNSLCATIPLPSYRTIIENARRHPQFILPIPREGVGAEIHFLQWTFPAPNTVTVLFTHLAEYKLRGEFAQPHTTVTHHLELAESKGLVLLEGSVVEGRGVTVDEGKWLLMCLQKFYGLTQGDEVHRRRELMEQFSHGDGSFSVEDLVAEAEKIG